MKLGLLFGEDIEASTDESPEVLSFHHKLLQEYMAAVYITEKLKTDESFLMEAFPTWEEVEQHKEVINFACGVLSEGDATPVTNHVAKIIAQRTYKELDSGLQPSLYRPYEDTARSLLATFTREGCDDSNNPAFCEYSVNNKQSLCEVLKTVNLVYFLQEQKCPSFGESEIDQIFKNDMLLSNTKIIMLMDFFSINDEDFKTLGKYLKTNIVALRAADVITTKLENFTRLKYLDIIAAYESDRINLLEGLEQSINSWGSEPQLRCLNLTGITLSASCLRAICKCHQLQNLNLYKCDFLDGIASLMASPPLSLRIFDLGHCSLDAEDIAVIVRASKELEKLQELVLNFCSLQAEALAHFTEAFNQQDLGQIQKLDLSDNPFGEPAVDSLLCALLTNRCNKALNLNLANVGGPNREEVSLQFASEWKTKMEGTKISLLFGTFLEGDLRRKVNR